MKKCYLFFAQKSGPDFAIFQGIFKLEKIHYKLSIKIDSYKSILKIAAILENYLFLTICT